MIRLDIIFPGGMQMNLIRIMILPLLLAVHGLTLGGIDRGNAAYNQGDYGSALQEWRPLAEQGNAGAQLNRGFMYDNGDGAALPSAVLVDANGTMAQKQGFIQAYLPVAGR